MWEVHVATADEMVKLGRCMAAYLCGGDIVALYGPLGTGKTTLIQGIAEGLETTKRIISPTFVLVREYSGRLPLFHVDAYRLEGIDPSDIDWQVSFSEYISRGGVVVIEWAEYIKQLLPNERLDVFLSHESVGRNVKFLAHGERHSKLLLDVREGWKRLCKE
ncbi:MAG: tRNA (adenosine(37)-N6)-threonylcarbamoyltransferase complex ATPase subunit type 1 TsaE [Armatimonadota bacterium]|nr:tRNA (adenosine(37)-N6)-threonylcarbamoyltransferase complex ATPase subunit type 1 TsaE [Armatimonadota bacterium]MCX7777114.1 tRNA (adenosine(37)-N6)-threonylcarbamoyltransferase complex ATPase subunit type 1 TsaE [Armatimonadota bacterium]MDW8025161.1 tRNA (adenosine(37)-N6)-threonylcarbamoyltransferase complex ATPase subunit type 1 TsaE [Armatimonadota bacterium]